MELKKLVNICHEKGIHLYWDDIDKLHGCWGVFDPQFNEIGLDLQLKDKPEHFVVQILSHELFHALDEECHLEQTLEGEVHCELRAEFFSKLVVGDNYEDDGFIDELQGELRDLGGDDLDVLDDIDDAEKLFFRLKL